MLDHDDDDPYAGLAEPSPLAALLERSPALQELALKLARNDMSTWDQEQAALSGQSAQIPERPPSRVCEPNGRRQTKKRQRRILFDSLRARRGREQACADAGVSRETFELWCSRPEFYEAVLYAEHYEHVDSDDDW